MTDYSTLKVPEAMVNAIKKFIEENPELGYRNPSEFMIEAIRKRLEEKKIEND